METPSPSRRDDQPDEFPETDSEEQQQAGHDEQDQPQASADADGAAAEHYGEEDSDETEADVEPAAAHDPAEPLTLSELLTGTARGDESSFAAFYEATSDVVYGLALLMHEHPDGAYYSTVAVYEHLWEQLSLIHI